MSKLVASYPAWDVYDETDEKGILHIEGGDQLCLAPNYTRTFTVGSIRHYMTEKPWENNTEEMIEAEIDRAIEAGHNVYWLLPNAATITSRKQVKKELKAVEVGTVVELEGNLFEVAKAFNGNLKLVNR